MAFGAANKEYSAKASFYADDLVANNRINWFFVPRDTPVYDNWTVFWPRLDDLGDFTSPYERVGITKLTRKYTDLLEFAFDPHDMPCGDEDDFLGLSLHDKYLGDDGLMHDPGHRIQGFRLKLGLGTSRKALSVVEKKKVGVGLAMVAMKPAAMLPAGLGLAMIAQAAKPAGLPLGLGLGLTAQNFKEVIVAVGLAVTSETSASPAVPLGLGMTLTAQTDPASLEALPLGVGVGTALIEPIFLGIGLALDAFSLEPTADALGLGLATIGHFPLTLGLPVGVGLAMTMQTPLDAALPLGVGFAFTTDTAEPATLTLGLGLALEEEDVASIDEEELSIGLALESFDVSSGGTTYIGSAVASTSNITLDGPGPWPAVIVGNPVTGPGIAPGTHVSGILFNNVLTSNGISVTSTLVGFVFF